MTAGGVNKNTVLENTLNIKKITIHVSWKAH